MCNKEKDKILASFRSRLKATSYNYESALAELELMANEQGVTVQKLFVLAETDQLQSMLNDKVMSLVSLTKMQA